MSTEQFYLRSDGWQSRPPEENGRIIERELIPKLIKDAALLKAGSSVQRDTAEEDFWIQKIAWERKVKAPKSLGCFLIALYVAIAVILVMFVKAFFF